MEEISSLAPFYQSLTATKQKPHRRSHLPPFQVSLMEDLVIASSSRQHQTHLRSLLFHHTSISQNPSTVKGTTVELQGGISSSIEWKPEEVNGTTTPS
uniref:Uncharacterized protein n=1 Tax=Lotus japonicus TaxID=34305 RepID=I3T1B7_LOTJA|nr:unknown [Lotus japonicus]